MVAWPLLGIQGIIRCRLGPDTVLGKAFPEVIAFRTALCQIESNPLDALMMAVGPLGGPETPLRYPDKGSQYRSDGEFLLHVEVGTGIPAPLRHPR